MDQHSAIAAQKLIIDAAAADVFGSFRSASVPAILLKGPTVSRWLYARDELRGYGDIDVLVSPHALETARRTLNERGFEKLSVELRGDRPRAVEEWQRPRDGVLLDLHVNLEGIRISSEDAWPLLSDGTERIDVSGRQLDALGIPARALHLTLHASQHGRQVEQPLLDLGRALERLPHSTWEEARVLAGCLDAEAAMSAGLRLVRAGAELADELGLPEALDSATSLGAASAGSAALFLDHVSSMGSWREKAILLVRKAFPPPPYMRSWLQQPDVAVSGIVLGYLYRPFWLLRQAIKGRGRRRSVL